MKEMKKHQQFIFRTAIWKRPRLDKVIPSTISLLIASFMARTLGSLTPTKIFIQFLLCLFLFLFYIKYVSGLISDYIKASLPMCLRDRIGRMLAIEPGLVICTASSSPAVLCHTSAYTFLLIQS